MTNGTENRKRDLLSFTDIKRDELQGLFQKAEHLKQSKHDGRIFRSLKGRTLGMIFEKSSTRTRVSFEVGMYLLGGKALFLSSKDIQLGRGETVSDSALVLSRYVDGLMVRTFGHSRVETMAKHATVPVINGLSDDFHPCQVLTDLFTFQENRGNIYGKKVAWIGDGNNMSNTWVQAAARAGFHLTIACPINYEPDPAVVKQATQEIQESGEKNASITIMRNPMEAAENADLITTDVWASMGQEEESQQRMRAFKDYCVDQKVMEQANKEALFMHCLPAHRGEEVTSEVLEGPQSVIWDEAENRLHVQNAILEWLLCRETL
ncbi:ornithine carbamoyltransferase [Magnetococcales bacterium HHB-1]